MKKTLISIIALILCLNLLFTSCQFLPATPDPVEPDDSVDDLETPPSPIPADVPQRFKTAYTIDRAKLEAAARAAADKLLERYAEGGSSFPSTCSVDYQYILSMCREMYSPRCMFSAWRISSQVTRDLRI